MEVVVGSLPESWSTTSPDAVTSITHAGRVHSGMSAVNLQDNSNLFQLVDISGGCYYDFSFFVQGEGMQGALTAMVTFFHAANDATEGLTITISSQDMPTGDHIFGYYRGITTIAPSDAVTAEIRFEVTASEGQSLDLDDVSFSIN